MTSLGERQLEDLYSKLAMDEDHEVRHSNRSDTAESDLDSHRVSPSEESGDSSEELTGASLAPYSFEPSERHPMMKTMPETRGFLILGRETDLLRPCTSQQRRSASPSLDMLTLLPAFYTYVVL